MIQVFRSSDEDVVLDGPHEPVAAAPLDETVKRWVAVSVIVEGILAMFGNEESNIIYEDCHGSVCGKKGINRPELDEYRRNSYSPMGFTSAVVTIKPEVHRT
jgi:hypothetical protein